MSIRWIFFVSILGLVVQTARAEDVVRPLSNGVVVNWTKMQIERWAGGGAVGVGAKQGAVEQRLREQIGPLLESNVLGVHVVDSVYVADLIQDQNVGGILNGRVNNWSVNEARYMASGRVEIMGSIDLMEFLRPWSIAQAIAAPETPAATQYTGLVVDVQGLGLRPCVHPSIRNGRGEVLHSGNVWQSSVLKVTPALYLPDAADARVVRAGKSPLLVRAAQASGCTITVRDADSLDIAVFGQSEAAGAGRVVIVTDAQ